jgi:hypothetical protein
VTYVIAEGALPSVWAGYTEINARWFKDRDAARELVNERKPA